MHDYRSGTILGRPWQRHSARILPINTSHSDSLAHSVGGGPTLSTSKFSIMNGKNAKASPVSTMTGKAMYRPKSNASDRWDDSFRFGTTPPKVAALISSSLASQDFIFSSSDNLAEELSSVSASVVGSIFFGFVMAVGRFLFDDDCRGAKP